MMRTSASGPISDRAILCLHKIPPASESGSPANVRGSDKARRGFELIHPTSALAVGNDLSAKPDPGA